MGNFSQQQLNLIIAALANGKTIEELSELVNITSPETYLPLGDGTPDAKRASIPKIRGFLGEWSALTNTPTLQNGTGVAGDMYKVSAAGIVNFGSGNINFNVGDFVIYDGTFWSIIANQSDQEVDEVDVSAIWKSGFTFDVTANSYPISGRSYFADPGEVTLDASDPTLDRIDLIGAYKPTDEFSDGVVGKITGTPASSEVVAPPDYDPSDFYVIKQVIVRAASTQPEDVVNTAVYDEGVEWNPIFSSVRISETANDPSTGSNSIEATNSLRSDWVEFEAPGTQNSLDIDLLTFDIKLKEVLPGKYIAIRFYNAGTYIGLYMFNTGKNRFDDSSLAYQNIAIFKEDLNFSEFEYDSFHIQVMADTTGFFIDNVNIYKGSGAEPSPESGVNEAPTDGAIYGRQNAIWAEIIADLLRVINVSPTNYTANGTVKSHLDGIDLALGNIQLTTAGILTRIYFTGDEETTSEGTFYLSSASGKGSVANVQQNTSNGDNAKSFFSQDILSPSSLVTSKAVKGSYSARLDVQTEGLGGGNSYSQRFAIEIYLADSNGGEIDSGLASQSVGDLGVRPLLVLDSGVLDLQVDSKTSILLTGELSEDVDLPLGTRIRYHVSAQKVGTAGGSVTQSMFLGSDNNSFYEVPTPITSNSVINTSLVPGNTSTEVYDYLLSAIGNKIDNSEKGVANGVATLGSDGKLLSGQLPDLAITKVIVASENSISSFAANSASYAFEEGDVILITTSGGDTEHYIYKGGTKTSVSEYSLINNTEIGWSQIAGTPTTIAGYGITDFNSLGDARWLRSDVADTASGVVTFSAIPRLQNNGLFPGINFNDGTDNRFLFRSGNSLLFQYNGTDNGTIWHSLNDGTGSGLDADLLDGLHANQFLRSDVADTKTSGELKFNDNVTIGLGTSARSTIFSDGSSSYLNLLGGNFYIQDVGTNRFTFERSTGDFIATGDLIMSSNASYLYADMSSGASTRIHGINASNNEYIGSVDQTTSQTFLGINTGTIDFGNGRAVLDGSGNFTATGSINSTKAFINGGTGANLNIASNPNGTIELGNGSAGTLPAIAGKSNNNAGLFLIGATNDANANGDLIFNVRENDNTDFTTFTNKAFVWSRFGSELANLTRNGNFTNIGTIVSQGTGDSSFAGNLGLGTTAPTSEIAYGKILQLKSDGNGLIVLDHDDGGVTSDIGALTWSRNNDHLAHIRAKHDGATDSSFISFHTQSTGGSYIDLNSNERMRIHSSGNISIGNSNNTYKLDVSGTGRFTGDLTASNFVLSSDRSLKTNIQEVSSKEYVNVNWKTFELKENKGQKRYGVIAQELEETNPEFVRTNEKGVKSVAYIDLLIAKIAELESRLEKLGA